MVGLLSAAFVAGLLGSLHCVGMCGAFASSCARLPLGLPAWHLGRILTYALLGAVTGSVGRFLPGPPWLPAVAAALLLLWFALALAGVVREPRFVPPGLRAAATGAAEHASATAQFLFGVANGFLPCGLVYSALSIPLAAARPVPGAAAMLAFGAGTLPALSLVALGLRRVVLATLWRRRLFAGLVLVTGLWTIWARAQRQGFMSAHHHMMAPAPAAVSGTADSVGR
jgi:sulfite exporter TauE/SafE